MTRDEMVQLVGGFEGDLGLALQFVARKFPADLELCYEVLAEIRGKR